MSPLEIDWVYIHCPRHGEIGKMQRHNAALLQVAHEDSCDATTTIREQPLEEILSDAADWYYTNDATLSRTAEKFEVPYQKLWEYLSEHREGLKTSYCHEDFAHLPTGNNRYQVRRKPGGLIRVVDRVENVVEGYWYIDDEYWHNLQLQLFNEEREV